MLRPITILAGLASLAAAGSVAAQTPEPEETEVEATNRIDLQEVVCRNVRPPTGTRLQRRRTERVCMTRADWDHQAQEAQDARRRMDRGVCGSKCNIQEPDKF